MANIDGGALSFKSVMENDQMNSAIEETLRRVQGLSDATVAGGKQMDKAFLQTTDGIRDALGKIGQACEIHETKLGELTGQYVQLGQEASAAFMAGRDEEYRAIEETRAGIQGEIAVRKQALEEARNLSNELEKEAAKREEATRQVEENASAHQSLRSRIRELKEEMALLIDQGIDEQSDAYKALTNELGRLQDIQGDIAQQGKILANDESKFQGLIQGLSGLAGGFSAATGAISLFAGENENLQKIMTKVQSVMAIAMGMQSVAQTLNKDSAFQLVTLNGLKEWWAGIVAKATVAETAETTAMLANTAAQQAQATATAQDTIAKGANTVATGAQTAAATAGTVANFTLAGAFRAVGLAIKSIPVFGWVLAGISALIALVAHFSNKAREAKKAQEEFTKAMVEGAYKPIGKIEELSAKYTALGNNIKEKEQFINDNKKAFDELGVSVTSVRDAENLLIKNKDAFITAQIAKAKALVYSQQAAEKIKKQMELQAEYDAMPNYVTKTYFHDGGNYTQMSVENVAKEEKKKEIEALNKEIKDGYNNVIQEEAKAIKTMQNSGIKSTKEYAQGTVGAIKKAISEKQEALNDLVPNSAEWNKVNKDIEALQKKLEKPGKKTTSKSDDVKLLEARKAEYERFNEELVTQLNNAKTTLDALSIIADKRKELANSGMEVDNDKKMALNEAEKDVLQKQKEETDKLLEDYASYLDKKIKLDLQYSNDLALLEKARANATTDAERNSIDAAIDNRKNQYKKDSELSGDSEYDQMLQTYRTFEQKKEDIIEEFNEKRKKAQEHGNTEMLAQLDKVQNEALSKLAIDEMKNSPDWEKMFGNLDEIGTRELEHLLATIEGKTAILGIELSPEDFKVIQDKVNELKNEIKERNPFKALSNGFKDLKKATNDQGKMAALAGMFDSASKAGNQLKGVISDVTGTLEALGVEGTEEIGHAIQALDGLASGAQDAIMGYMSGNPVQMVGGAVKAVGSIVSYFVGANDRRAEKAIKKHQENVKNLTSAYKELEWQISKALSGNVYKHQQASIENMKQQQRELQGMIRAEYSKKKTDHEKIREWREQIKELNRSIEDTIDGMKKSLLDTDVKAIASQLGDAIIGAFENGKDAATAWGDTVKNIVNNLVKNMLIQKVLQEPIDKVISKYTSKWVDKNGVFKGFDVVIGDIDSLSSELGGLYPSLERSINALKEKLNISTLENDSSLTGAVKGVTEETASIVAGQLNAMRINQVEASAILRQQLAMLSVIAQNTSYNRFLVEIHKELKAINSSSADPLRSQGLV